MDAYHIPVMLAETGEYLAVAPDKVILDGDATLGGTNRWDLRNAAYSVDLFGYTLTKVAVQTEAVRVGDPVHALIDWDRRYARMRIHTALHLLSAVLPFPVTGGAVGDNDGRLDFDIPESGLDKDEISAKLGRMIAANAEVRLRWITDDELAAKPNLVKTMSVMPPTGQGKVRLVRIGAPDKQVDLQPCGGTHVARTGEIGRVEIGKIEKKGRINRRVTLTLI